MIQKGLQMGSAEEREAAEATAKTGTDPAVLLAGASVLLSWNEFFIKGNRERGLFVALWPPTILAFASYFNQTEMSDRLRQML